MIIYADILIIVNTIVDYFILLLSAKINKAVYKNFRLLIGAFLGGISSLYIFLPQQVLLIELLYRIFTSLIITFAAFGFPKIKIFLRNTTVFLLTSLIYGGCVFAFWLIFKPNSIIINNSFVYYDISATYLLIFSVVIYLIITVIMSLLKREAVTAKRCKLVFAFKDRTVSACGILDTGNSVRDLLSDADVIFLSEKLLKKLFGEEFNEAVKNNPDRYRIIPCSTVTRGGVLEGLRCDKATIVLEEKSISLNKPILVKSQTEFGDDYDAVMNPEIMLRME